MRNRFIGILISDKLPKRGLKYQAKKLMNKSFDFQLALFMLAKFYTEFFFADPPSITKTPSNGLYEAHKGDDVTLSCVGSGKPKPTITWTRLVRLYFAVFSGSFFFCIAKYLQTLSIRR